MRPNEASPCRRLRRLLAGVLSVAAFVGVIVWCCSPAFADTGSPPSGAAVGAGGAPDLAARVADLEAYVRTMEKLHDLPVEVVHAGHDPSFGRDRLRELTRAYLDKRRPSLV